MSPKACFILGIVVIAMGAAIFWSSHTIWGIRGLLYMGFGIYLVSESKDS